MPFLRWLGLLCMGAAVLLGPGQPVAAKPHVVLAAVPISRTDLPWWRKRHEAKLEELRRAHPALVWLGDSITEDWEKHGPPAWQDFAPVWQRFYGDRNAVNLGFKGDTTASVIWRLMHGEADGIAPKVVVLLIGANNLGRPHWSAPDTVAGIDMILHLLREKLPRTKVLLLGVLPSERSDWVTATTKEVNAALAAKYGRGDGDVRYLDVSHVFLRDGRLNRDLFLDPHLTPPDPPLHPTAEGQALMAAAMEPTLAAMLGDRPHH